MPQPADDTRVTVIIAAKDASETVGRAIRSALAQPEAAEIIVIDDGSSDGTTEVARSYDDGSSRLTVHRLECNGGPAAARNRALDMARSPFVCVLDADDFMQPGRLARLLACAGTDWDMVADDLLIAPPGNLDGADATYRLLLGIGSDGHEPMVLGLRQFVLGNISRPRRARQEFGFLKPLIRRRFLEDWRMRYPTKLRLGEDYALYALMLARGARARLVGACGYVAVTRPDGLSSRHTADDLKALADVDLDLRRLPGLSSVEIDAFDLHRRCMLRKYYYHALLDAKRDGRLREAWGLFMKTPDVVVYVLRETLRARARALFSRQT
jgi:succinoglycan biosynthesis protein ExoU